VKIAVDTLTHFYVKAKLDKSKEKFGGVGNNM